MKVTGGVKEWVVVGESSGAAHTLSNLIKMTFGGGRRTGGKLAEHGGGEAGKGDVGSM
jgi:hypothetical protein